MTSTERPRRATRVPAKYEDKTAVEVPDAVLVSTPKKRKAPATKDSHDDPKSLDFLLSNPKSPLVNLEISTLINESTWTVLSQDRRALLSTMLPPTAFPFYRPSLYKNHPANNQRVEEESDTNLMDVDAMAIASEPDLNFFTDPFFEAGAKTFQDHLYSGWLTPTHETLIREYTENIKKGEVHSPWKDDVWVREHPAAERNPSDTNGPAGEASSVTLSDLTKHSIIRVGDVLAYRRHFSQLNRTIAKDVLIDSIQPSSYSITVLVAPSTRTHIPLAQIEHPATSKTSDDGSEFSLQLMTISNPNQLEHALLDTDASVERNKRPNSNAWKSIGVWRWRDGDLPEFAEGSEEAVRGGREYHGTLFYLRGCFYDDQ